MGNAGKIIVYRIEIRMEGKRNIEYRIRNFEFRRDGLRP
jgi:hypothetical protein